VSSKNRISRALTLVLQGGALGASFVLALTSAEATAKPVVASDPASQDSVAGRLREIRAGVAEISSTTGEGSAQPESVGEAKMRPTWWGNGGWGRWHPGWGNGGWRNGGWGNGWHNGGWGNGGWPNWHNGWHNFWHNW
jgi:rSAM-associated Gly-rich repeat protein